MEVCFFSLDKQPSAFQEFLHTKDTVQQLVLNALVQDLIRGTAFLHAHNIIKPGNVLVAFDRHKTRENKSKYWKEAQLKLTDFGVSRILPTVESKSFGGETTKTISVQALAHTNGIAGSQAYMCRDVLELIKKVLTDVNANVEIDADLLTKNDSFGLGCVIAYLCSCGLHPFELALSKNISSNIRANRRKNLKDLFIVDKRHVELVNRLTTWKAENLWTAAQALTSSIFENDDVSNPEVLLDQMSLFKPPTGSTCESELLAPSLVKICPALPAMMPNIHTAVARIMKVGKNVLDEDSCMAIIAYTMDNGKGAQNNLYFMLNQALRNRKKNPEAFREWQGFLYFLMRALNKLPEFKGIVYRGGNSGLDQDTIQQHYSPGRPIQWGAFSSTSLNIGTTKSFVKKDKGMLFKIKVLTGRNIGPYSFLPKESEILLTPNTRFVVTSDVYKDKDGYSCVELAESKGTTLKA